MDPRRKREYFSLWISYESCKEIISDREANERFAELNLATHNKSLPEPYLQGAPIQVLPKIPIPAKKYHGADHPNTLSALQSRQVYSVKPLLGPETGNTSEYSQKPTTSRTQETAASSQTLIPTSSAHNPRSSPIQSTRRVQQQPNLNPQRFIGSDDSVKVVQARAQVNKQSAPFNRSRNFDYQQRAASPSTEPQESLKLAQAQGVVNLHGSSPKQVSRFDDQRTNVQLPVRPRVNMEFLQDQGRVEPQASLSSDRNVGLDHQQIIVSSTLGHQDSNERSLARTRAKLEASSSSNRGTEHNHQQRTTSPPTEHRNNEEFAQGPGRVELEARSAFNKEIEFDYQQGTTSSSNSRRTSKEFARAQALARLEANSKFNKDIELDHQQRTDSPPPQTSKEIAQAEALAKLKANSEFNKRRESDDLEPIISPPNGPQDSKESAQAQARAKFEVPSLSNKDNRFNHQQRIASQKAGPQDNTDIIQRQERANPQALSSEDPKIGLNHAYYNVPPAPGSQDRIELGGISPNPLPARRLKQQTTPPNRKRKHFRFFHRRGPIGPRDSVVTTRAQRTAKPQNYASNGASRSADQYSEQRSIATAAPKPQVRRRGSNGSAHPVASRQLVGSQDSTNLASISPNLQARQARLQTPSSAPGNMSVTPSFTANVSQQKVGSSFLQKVRNVFGRSNKVHQGRLSPTMPSGQSEPKRKGDSTKASGEVSHSESSRSQTNDSQQPGSFAPKMTERTSSDAHVCSSLPAPYCEAQPFLDIISPSTTQKQPPRDTFNQFHILRSQELVKLGTGGDFLGSNGARNPPGPPLSALESTLEVAWKSQASLSVPRSNGAGGDVDISPFRDEKGMVPKPKVEKGPKWRVFLPKPWASPEGTEEVQDVTGQWNWVGSGEGEKGGMMTARGRLERYT